MTGAISGDLSANMDRNKLKVMDKVWGVDTVPKIPQPHSTALDSINRISPAGRFIHTGSDDGVGQPTMAVAG